MYELQIEFIGGPFDGHRQCVRIAVDDLVMEVLLPVNADVFRLVDGFRATCTAQTTSIALYRRDVCASGVRYRFAGAIAPGQTCVKE